MAFRWQADDGPTLNAGLVALGFFRGSGAVLLKKLYFGDFSRREGSEPPVPPPDLCMVNAEYLSIYIRFSLLLLLIHCLLLIPMSGRSLCLAHVCYAVLGVQY